MCDGRKECNKEMCDKIRVPKGVQWYNEWKTTIQNNKQKEKVWEDRGDEVGQIQWNPHVRKHICNSGH